MRRLDDREVAGLARWALEMAERWEVKQPRWAPFWDAIGELLASSMPRTSVARSGHARAPGA